METVLLQLHVHSNLWNKRPSKKGLYKRHIRYFQKDTSVWSKYILNFRKEDSLPTRDKMAGPIHVMYKNNVYYSGTSV